MRLEVFFCNFGVDTLVEEGVQELQLLFSIAFRHDTHEVDELAIIDRAVEQRTVLDHQKYLIRQVSILDLCEPEVLQ